MDLRETKLSETGLRSDSLVVLNCARCGEQFDASPLMPRMRCPHCGTVGYPDRSGLNLLPLDWECPACGALNSSTVNFCLSCGTGLASRCLRCEAPVYNAVCLHCGTHQAHLSSLQRVEAERAGWIPIVQERLREQKARQQAPAVERVVREWRPIDRSPHHETHQVDRRHRTWSRRSGRGWNLGRFAWGWAWIITGLVLLLWDTIRPLAAEGDLSTLPTVLAPVVNWLQGLWASLARYLPGLLTAASEHVTLLVTAACLLALLPTFLRLFDRIARWLFP